jgi:DNA replication licensing factor MCM5
VERNARSSIPITVRQLEAIIRITESLAKMTLATIATTEHVDEAIRLFLASTMDAVNQGQNQGSKELNEEVTKLEEELVEGKGYSETALNRALLVLQRRDTIAIRSQGSQIYRSGV